MKWFREKLQKALARYEKTSLTVVFSFVILCCLPALIFGNNIVSGDTAEYLDNPIRIFDGQIPYQDFWLLHGPGEVYFPYLIYRFVDRSVNVVLFVTTLSNIGVTLLASIVAYRLWSNKLYATIAGLLFFYNGVLYWYDTNYIHFYLAPILCSILLLEKAYTRGKWYLFASAGACLGLGVFFKTYVTCAAALAFCGVLFLRTWYCKSRKGCFAMLMYFGIGFIVSTLAFYSYFLYTLGPAQLITKLFIEPPSHSAGLNPEHRYFSGTILFIEKLFDNHLSIFDRVYTVYQVINSGLLYLLPFFFGVMFVVLLKRKKFKNDTKELLCMSIFFWSLVSMPLTITLSDLSHYAYAVTPLFLLLPLIYYGLDKISVYIGIGVIGILVLACPMHIVKDIFKNYGQKQEISSQYGSVRLIDSSRHEALHNVLYSVSYKYKEYGTLLALDGSIPYYALTGLHNPTYYDSFFDLVYRPNIAQEEDTCLRIKKNSSLLVTAHDIFPPLPVLYQCIIRNFQPVEKYGTYTIWQLKSQ